MTFDLFGQLVLGPATEDVRIMSQWLSTGAGPGEPSALCPRFPTFR